jgi:hypothetical protein
MKQPLLSLAVEQIVDGPDAKPGLEQVLAQDAAEISQTARNDNPLAHPRDLPEERNMWRTIREHPA